MAAALRSRIDRTQRNRHTYRILREAACNRHFRQNALDKYYAMNATRVSYALESTLASVNTAEQAAHEAAARSGFDEDEGGHIAIAVREATANAILHGNRYDPAKRVTLSFESTPESLTITVRDEGPGLDPATIPDPLAPENFLKQSGRGIFLIRAFMDEVGFHDVSPGTEVTMTKFLRGPGLNHPAREDKDGKST